MTDLAPLAFACHAASLCDGKSAENISVLRLPAGGEFELVVLSTARSERQAYALIDEVFGFCKRYKIDHRPVEGEAGWYLIDCHQVIVHALGEDQRAFYNFEKLWKKAVTIDWRAELAKLPELPETKQKPKQE